MKINRHQAWGGILFLAGFGFTIYLGFLSGADKQPSRVTSALLVILAGIFQFWSAAQFNKIGKAEPGLARAAVRRLVTMAKRTQHARLLAEESYDGSNATQIRRAMGRISVDLSWIEEGIIHSVQDWNEFHKDALSELMEEEVENGED